MNLNDYSGFLDIVHQVRPTQSTLIPDAPDQKMSDHGWDLKEDGIRVSLFIDPNHDQIYQASELGTDRIELYPEVYAMAYEGNVDKIFERYYTAAKYV